MELDHKLLLRKYIEHVAECEGVDFIMYCNDHTHSGVKFSDAEVAELELLKKEGYHEGV